MPIWLILSCSFTGGELYFHFTKIRLIRVADLEQLGLNQLLLPLVERVACDGQVFANILCV
jgi:hypothetical protein